MIVTLNIDNKLELTDKAMQILDFRELYNYYAVKLNNEERAMAAFGVLYYMYYFDSRFLDLHEDETDRLKAVKEFVYKGSEITKIKVFAKAAETYKKLMDEEQTMNYVVMKANVKKLRDFAKAMVLMKDEEQQTQEEKENDVPAKKSTGIKVRLKEFLETNSALPKQEEDLTKFKERLLKHFDSQVDIFGGGSTGAYE